MPLPEEEVTFIATHLKLGKTVCRTKLIELLKTKIIGFSFFFLKEEREKQKFDNLGTIKRLSDNNFDSKNSFGFNLQILKLLIS